MNWEDLDYWRTGEWQVVQERLDDDPGFCPRRDLMFEAMVQTPFEKTRVMIVGQDPYPDPEMACGLAFSVPLTSSRVKSKLPPTLINIFDEYVADLHLPRPTNGSLIPWAQRGVMLWNAYPTCKIGQSMSHRWSEWEPLTREMISTLCTENTKLGLNVVFVLIGSASRSFATNVTGDHPVVETAHPSPLARRAKNPFKGSRVFSSVNAKLAEKFMETIDWRLT